MPSYNKPKFLLIGGFASSLINFRGPLIKSLTKNFEVYAAAPFIDAETKSKVEALGATCISNEFERTGLNPLKDLRAYYSFKSQIKKVAPDYALAYTIKPVVFGLRATKSDKTKRFALITGRGSGFEGKGLKGGFIKKLVKSLYRQTLRSVDGVVFQNKQDQEFFLSEGILDTIVSTTVIEGTGVDLNHYCLRSEPRVTGKIKFLFIARLIKEKGIPELVEAARILKKTHDNFEVQLLGWIDPNPGGISKLEIEELHSSGVIRYLGTTDDIRPYMEAADVFVLPSYYNEGLPRTIQEAMAMKKPIITTDHPGCRETVVQGLNGFLVPTQDAQALAERMEYFIQNPQEVLSMGKESHKLAVEKFDVHEINKQLINFMGLNDV